MNFFIVVFVGWFIIKNCMFLNLILVGFGCLVFMVVIYSWDYILIGKNIDKVVLM